MGDEPKQRAANWHETASLAVEIGVSGTAARPMHGVRALAFRSGGKWRTMLSGAPGREFSTSVGSADAAVCVARKTEGGGWEIRLSGAGEHWSATSVVTLPADEPVIRRTQTFRFLKPCVAAIHPGFKLAPDPAVRYTMALQAHEAALAGLRAARPAVDWALPFPFHQWHDGSVVAIYGVDRVNSKGTLDLAPTEDGGAMLRVHYPDVAAQHNGGVPHVRPEAASYAAGDEVTLTEIFSARELTTGEEPWIEAQRMAAGILLRTEPHPMDAKAVAAGIVSFFHRCELWEPNALGPGRGWFSNMWVRTQTGPAKKRGEMSGYFDFGWGEGIAVEIWMGVVRHGRRTGDRSLLPLVDEMTRGMEFFKRAGEAGAYFDRTDGTRCGDFLMDHVPGRRIWTHSLGHTGSQLIQLYQEAPHYPDAETRKKWLTTATAMGAFLARQQREDGDLPDILDDDNREANRKPHRITARVVVCGLWTRLGQVTGDSAWIERAGRLAAAVAPAIQRYEYFNQMLDGIIAAEKEFVDAEAACYALEGLVPLYAETRAPAVLALCQKAAAFAFAWTYFHDLPHAHKGIARGGQCCRMDDYPLLYPIGPAKAMEPVLALARITGDPFYRKMADEMAAFIGNWQMDAPGQPWHGGMIHALGQFSGKHWGPDLAGQIDTGMATGNSLAALECWLAERK
jgi:rhamnogalacturonyl hydrolase YesR